MLKIKCNASATGGGCIRKVSSPLRRRVLAINRPTIAMFIALFAKVSTCRLIYDFEAVVAAVSSE